MFALWFVWMAVYYCFRMFSLTPWYDELYTYYYFISRGPVYAAIHWPLPNNHVGYSVLSGFLDLLGNPVLGLRGISYLAALANLLLLYKIGKKCFSEGWSFCCVALYSCMQLVNQLAVQGRGYTLAVSCFLTAVLMLQEIGWKEKGETAKDAGKKKDIKYYVIFSFYLTLGLYILPSSVYWVVPVCMVGGLFLLLYQKIKALVCLIISSVIAAWHTLLLYALIWLAIGSNLMSKAEGGALYGQGHFGIIRSAPFLALRTGMDYMLATPYIQSVEREGFVPKLAEWFRFLFDFYYSGLGTVLLGITAFGLLFAVWQGRRAYKEGRWRAFFLFLFVAVVLLLMPVFLLIQCALPYFRVFSYIGIPVSMLLCLLLQDIAGKWSKFPRPFAGKAAVGACTLLAIVLLLSKEYNNEYGLSEYYARDALENAGVKTEGKLCVTDCYQQYLLKFYYGFECENTAVEEADTLLLHKEMTVPGGDFRWEFYHTYDTLPWEMIEKGMHPVYENEEYIVYIRK